QPFPQLLFGLEADHFGDHFTVFKHHQGRNAHHPETAGRFRIVIHIQLGNLQFIPDFIVQLLQNGSDHFARTTPGSPKINQYGSRFHFIGKILVRHIYDGHDGYLLNSPSSNPTNLVYHSGAKDPRYFDGRKNERTLEKEPPLPAFVQKYGFRELPKTKGEERGMRSSALLQPGGLRKIAPHSRINDGV